MKETMLNILKGEELNKAWEYLKVDIKVKRDNPPDGVDHKLVDRFLKTHTLEDIINILNK